MIGLIEVEERGSEEANIVGMGLFGVHPKIETDRIKEIPLNKRIEFWQLSFELLSHIFTLLF